MDGDSRSGSAAIKTPQTEPGTARSERVHAVTLLCAESVVSMVGEVSRSLVGLGFTASVITGSDARAALMNRDRTTDVPMIYVVCVQGDLKDTVLGPLRQALATHGGPNEHLFVAVLDLSLPLSMVGQVRRFAEALERAPDAGPDPLDERRQWREHSRSHHFDEDDTRSYRTVRSVDEPSVPRTPTGARQIITAAKPPRIEPTRKYRAITGPLPTVPRDKDKGANRVGRDVGRGEAVRRRIAVPGLETRTIEPEAPVRPAPKFGAAIAPETPSRSGGVIVLAVTVLLAAGAATYILGGADRWLPANMRRGPAPQETVARAGVVSDAPQADKADAPSEQAQPAGTGGEPAEAEVARDAEVVPADVDDSAAHDSDDVAAAEADAVAVGEGKAGDADDAVAADSDGPADEPDSDPDPVAEPEPEPVAEPEPEPVAEPEPEPVAEPEPEPVAVSDADVEQSLAAAIARREVKVSNKYFVAASSRDKTNWDTAKRRCFDLEIDGVGNWRLPFRRELQLLGAIGMLGKGSYWSKTVDLEDMGFAFVYERAGRRLVSWEKSEPARVACVRRR